MNRPFRARTAGLLVVAGLTGLAQPAAAETIPTLTINYPYKEESFMQMAMSSRVPNTRRGVRRGLLHPCLGLALALAVPAMMFLSAGDASARGGEKWFSAWTSPASVRLATPVLTGSSVRMIVLPTVSGNSARVKLENTMGQSPVVFSAAYLGELAAGANLVPGSNTQLTFGGNSGLQLAPGAGAWSDPIKIKIKVNNFTRYAISLDVLSASDISAHALGLTTNYMAPGMQAADASGSAFVPLPDLKTGIPVTSSFPFYWVAALDVESPSTTGTIVAFGDSITDGRCSTTEVDGSATGAVVPDLYQRWTDILAERLSVLPANQSKAMANEGIAGNRIFTPGAASPTALSRMDRDVLERAGATHVIFFEGSNDIVGGATAATVIAATQQVIDRTHAAGLKSIGVTIIPRGSAAGFTTFMEQQRLAVNAWTRTQANYDGIIDFAELLKGPIVPSNGAERIPPEYSCFDGVHPNPTAYDVMGNYVDVGLFTNQAAWSNGH